MEVDFSIHMEYNQIDEMRYLMRHIVNNIPLPEEDTLATPDEIDDVFSYHKPTDEEAIALDQLRQHFRSTAQAIQKLVLECPYRTIAFRKLHEANMVANAAIVLKGRSLR